MNSGDLHPTNFFSDHSNDSGTIQEHIEIGYQHIYWYPETVFSRIVARSASPCFFIWCFVAIWCQIISLFLLLERIAASGETALSDTSPWKCLSPRGHRGLLCEDLVVLFFHIPFRCIYPGTVVWGGWRLLVALQVVATWHLWHYLCRFSRREGHYCSWSKKWGLLYLVSTFRRLGWVLEVSIKLLWGNTDLLPLLCRINSSSTSRTGCVLYLIFQL